jgi:hypothetical protein
VALTEQVGHAEQVSQGASDCVEAERVLENAGLKLGERNAWVGFIQKASSAFADAEVKLSTTKVQALETEYQTLHDKITDNPEKSFQRSRNPAAAKNCDWQVPM